MDLPIENKEKAKKMLKSALFIGPIMPAMTIAFMYAGFKLGNNLGKPFDMILSLIGALTGFSFGTIIVWLILKVISRRVMNDE